jgi:hypothetical protein
LLITMVVCIHDMVFNERKLYLGMYTLTSSLLDAPLHELYFSPLSVIELVLANLFFALILSICIKFHMQRSYVTLM